MTFQNIFSSMADFRDTLSVLLAAQLIKASKYKIFVAVQKANRPWEISLSWLFDCHRSRARNIKKAAARKLFGAKKGRIFGLIHFFKSFCIYFIPHNYVIPQANPHAIPQTHSVFYPHRLEMFKTFYSTSDWRNDLFFL